MEAGGCSDLSCTRATRTPSEPGSGYPAHSPCHLLSLRVSFSTGSLRVSRRATGLREPGVSGPSKHGASSTGGCAITDSVRPSASSARARSASRAETKLDTASYTVKVMMHLR